MKKQTLVLASVLALGTTTLMAGNCSTLKVGFTFFGAPDKSYVVKDNTFKTITPTFTGDKLEGATAVIDLMTLDTSADMNNGPTAKWPAAMATVRDNNTRNGLFKKFKAGDGKAMAKIAKVNADSVDVEIAMNGVTETINMKTKTEGDMTVATGKLDIIKFAPVAFKSFETICRGFHKGKTNSEIEISFAVPAACK
ncbi:MAG: hypothetical protein HF962_02175 [Sulfurovum sp.]|nr:hypothetical protein [Sulfurovum sp.]